MSFKSERGTEVAVLGSANTGRLLSPGIVALSLSLNELHNRRLKWAMARHYRSRGYRVSMKPPMLFLPNTR
jgi:hypothetical protein